MNRGRHLFDGHRRFDGLRRLVVAAAGEVRGDVAQLADGGADLPRGGLHLADDLAQLADHQVERIGHRAGHVVGHLGLHRQVAFGDAADFVEQLHDRRLHAIALLARVDERHGVIEHAVDGAADAAQLGVARRRHARREIAVRHRFTHLGEPLRLRDDGPEDHEPQQHQRQDERDAQDDGQGGVGAAHAAGDAAAPAARLAVAACAAR